jgi:hypothetical protein
LAVERGMAAWRGYSGWWVGWQVLCGRVGPGLPGLLDLPGAGKKADKKKKGGKAAAQNADEDIDALLAMIDGPKQPAAAAAAAAPAVAEPAAAAATSTSAAAEGAAAEGEVGEDGDDGDGDDAGGEGGKELTAAQKKKLRKKQKEKEKKAAAADGACARAASAGLSQPLRIAGREPVSTRGSERSRQRASGAVRAWT